MTYTEFRDDILKALYQEREHEGETDVLSFSTLVKDYDLEWKDGWLIEAQRDLQGEGLIEAPNNSQNDNMAVGRINGAGMRFIERKYGSKGGVGTLLSKVVYDDLIVPIIDEPDDSVMVIDSAAWTGFEAKVARDPALVAQISLQIHELSATVDKLELTNSERAKIKAITSALTSLVSSPEPEWKVIFDLLQSPTLQAFLGLAGLTQLILKLMFGIG